MLESSTHNLVEQESIQQLSTLLEKIEKIEKEDKKEVTPKIEKIEKNDKKEITPKVEKIQKGEKKEITPKVEKTLPKKIDDYYCDFSLEDDAILKMALTSQIDSSVYTLILSPQQKKLHEELNFFESNLQIYEYIQQNCQLIGEDKQHRLIAIEDKGKVMMKVVSTIGKKERQRTICLQTHRVQEDKDIYMENVIRKLGKKVQQLKKDVTDLKQEQKQLRQLNSQLMVRIDSYGIKLPLMPDKNDAHFCKFKEMDKRIIKTVDNTTYFSIFGDRPIPKTGTSYFTIRIVNSVNRNIMIGIASKFTKGISNVYSHEDFIGFYLFGEGFIWEKSSQRQLNLKNVLLVNGVTITTVINMNMGVVCWQICGLRVAYAVLPLELKAKLLLPAILMINVNDEIECDR